MKPTLFDRITVAILLPVASLLARYYRRPGAGSWLRSAAYRLERRIIMFLRPTGGPWVGHQTWVFRDGVVRG